MERKYFHEYFQFIMKVKLSDLNYKFNSMTPSLRMKLKANKYALISARNDIDDVTKTLEMITLYFGENTTEIYDPYVVFLYCLKCSYFNN